MSDGYRGGMLGFDNDRPFRYFQNSVDRSWNPNEISFERDRKNLTEAYDGVSDEAATKMSTVMKKLLGMFGAGEVP
jgi:hypothetical protein